MANKPSPAGQDKDKNSTGGQRDPRAIIAAVTGLTAILLIAVIGYLLLPGSIPEDQVNTKGQNIVAIASAAITAVGTVVSAYFGIKAANVAREESAKASERHEARAAALAAAPPEGAEEAMNAATRHIKDLGV
jgi:hypothetical protein